MAYALIDMANILRGASLNVQEEAGWETRGHMDMAGVKGIVLHDTAGPLTGDSPSLSIVINGRSGPDPIVGPLAQLFLSRSGVFHVVAAGLCYHAGKGQGFGLPVNQANRYTIGIEAENTGLANDPWPNFQKDQYARGCAALANAYKFPVNMVIGHLEWAPTRKIDPSFSCPDFRTVVAGYMAA